MKMHLNDFLAQPHNKRYHRGFYVEPSCLTSSDWKLWRSHIKTNHPIQYFLRETVGTELRYIRWRVRDFWHSLKDRFWNKHNLLKLRDDPGYINPNHKLFLAFERIVVDFVEKEKPFELINWDSDDEHKNAAKVIKEAYQFFKTDHPALEKEIEDIEETMFGGGCLDDLLDTINNPSEQRKKDLDVLLAKEQSLKDKTQQIMISVIKAKDFLWV